MRDGAAQAGATIAGVRVLLGNASVKTTSIYLFSDEERKSAWRSCATAAARPSDDDPQLSLCTGDSAT